MDIYAIREEIIRNHKRLSEIPLRVAYYARVSTEKDAQLHSLSSQREYFENKIEKNPNWTLVSGYIDEGISATTVRNRENFLEMIKDAKMHKFDLILTKEITRFARNTIDSLSYTQQLLRYGVGVCFENDNINTLEPDSELRLTIMSGIAQDESRKISERVSFGFKRSVERGVVLGNDAIWGYRKNKGKLEIVPDEAEMVRKIFELCADENMGVRKIASTVSEMGYKNPKGNPISFSTVKGILKNPKYKGFYCGNKSHKIDFRRDDVKRLPETEWIVYEDNEAVPAIVAPELWERANEKLKERSKKATSPDKTSYHNKYTYSGKILCQQHNVCYHHTVFKYKSGNKELWTCREYARGNKCNNPLIYTMELDKVMKIVYDLFSLEKEQIINELMSVYKACMETKTANEMKHKFLRNIKTFERRKEKLLELVMDGSIPNHEFKEKNDKLNVEIKKLKEELVEIEIREEERHSEKVFEQLRKAIKSELEFSDKSNKTIADNLADRIIVSKASRENDIDLTIFLKFFPKDQKRDA